MINLVLCKYLIVTKEIKDMNQAIKTRGRKFSGTVGPTDDKK